MLPANISVLNIILSLSPLFSLRFVFSLLCCALCVFSSFFSSLLVVCLPLQFGFYDFNTGYIRNHTNKKSRLLYWCFWNKRKHKVSLAQRGWMVYMCDHPNMGIRIEDTFRSLAQITDQSIYIRLFLHRGFR